MVITKAGTEPKIDNSLYIATKGKVKNKGLVRICCTNLTSSDPGSSPGSALVSTEWETNKEVQGSYEKPALFVCCLEHPTGSP